MHFSKAVVISTLLRCSLISMAASIPLGTRTTSADIPDFTAWESLRIQLPNVQLHMRYYSKGGPPVMLLHGQPQHSLSFKTIAPLLAAQNYTVIVPDQRGSGASMIPINGNYTAAALHADIEGILDYLNITETFFVAHDLGSKGAVDFALDNPKRLAAITTLDIALPGFGIQAFTETPQLSTDFNFQIPLLETPDIAEWLVRGREREFLEWYFWHYAYQGMAVSMEDLNEYVRDLTKPGFLRSMIGWYAADIDEGTYFQERIGALGKVKSPMLYLGGEASGGIPAIIGSWSNVSEHLTTGVIPKSGHWVGDENPHFVAKKVIAFFEPYKASVKGVDLSILDEKVTLVPV